MDFINKALITGMMIGVPAALLSCFLVMKGWALMGDAISHSVLPGIAVAYILGLPLVAGAFGAGMLATAGIGYLSRNSRLKQDSIMGVVFSGMFGAGVVMIAAIESDIHLHHVLFGNILGLERGDMVLCAAIALPVTVILLLKWKDFLLWAFDPVQAHTLGWKAGWLHYGLLVMLTLVVVALMRATGLVLAMGLLIGPGAIGLMLSRRFETMMAIAVAATMVAVAAGLWLSVRLDAAAAPSIILCLMGIFLITLAMRMIGDWRKTRAAQCHMP